MRIVSKSSENIFSKSTLLLEMSIWEERVGVGIMMTGAVRLYFIIPQYSSAARVTSGGGFMIQPTNPLFVITCRDYAKNRYSFPYTDWTDCGTRRRSLLIIYPES